MKKLFVVKIGGNVLDNDVALESFLKDFASIDSSKILIHGGGKIATRIGDQLGIESKYINGRRITDAATIDLVTMVYGGLVNKQIVARLQHLDCNALGVTGADGNILKAKKRPVKDVDFGFVGDVTADGFNRDFVSSLLNQGIVPVFAPLTHADGKMLNTNADTIASMLAVGLSSRFDVRLIYCFEKKGVLRDVNDVNSVIHHLPESLYKTMLPQNIFADGILPKLENAYAAINAGVREVLIGEAGDLLKNVGATTEGTLITS
jgi:acetylglutamate kinase